MKAIRYESFGPPERLQLKELAVPVPLPHQVLIKVHAASINAKESRRFEMSSLLVRMFTGGWVAPKDPAIGTDVAGVVAAVGETVTRFKPGDAVFGCAHGSFAEYVLARESYLVLKPADRSFADAAALPLAALTALQALRFAGGFHPGQQVLVQGASGGIGTFALQLAKAAGAQVTAVCSTRNMSQARSLGADHVIDYAKEDFTKKDERYDLILAINGYHPLWAYRRALKPEGQYVFVGGAIRQVLEVLLFGKWLSKKGGKTMGSMGITKLNPDDLREISDLLEDGKLVPLIERVFPLYRTADAFRFILDHHARGKVIIEVIKG